MSRTLTTDVSNEITSDSVVMGFLLETQFPGETTRVWTGYGDLEHDIDGDGSRETFLGVGDMLSVDEVRETENLEAVGVTFTLTGIPQDNLSPDRINEALNEDYQGDKAQFWVAFFDEQTYNLIADPVKLLRGRMDVMSVNLGSDTLTVRLDVESILRDLQRPNLRRQTNQDQQAEFSNDKFFEFMPEIAEKEFQFGPPKTKQPDSGFF